MSKYLELNRRFGLLTDYTSSELFASEAFGKYLTWDKVLEGRFSVIIGRANFGKTMELKAKSESLRAQGLSSIFVALHKVLGESSLEDSLESKEKDSLLAWKETGGPLTVFIDSLDEASLSSEDGIQKALSRVVKGLDWPVSDIRWIFSSRPAVLTQDILNLLQAELATVLYTGVRKESLESDVDSTVVEGDITSNDIDLETDATKTFQDVSKGATLGGIASVDAKTKIAKKNRPLDPLKVYSLLKLDKAAAELYLKEKHALQEPKKTLNAAWHFGLRRLSEGPGGLDVLVFIDLVESPPQNLTEIFEKMVNAVQQQQRSDVRERLLRNLQPESLENSIELLASASMVCQLPNIEISSEVLRYREGVLSARPIIASLLSEQTLTYLLGSRLFIDSGHHQVKLYPDELLPFLAAKRLASLVRSPEGARRLLANFTWHSTTGECGVYRTLLSLAGWLSVFSAHCRQVLLIVEPQSVAFFGDLRNQYIQLDEASLALERTIERLVSEGDTLGRSYFSLTAENYWQAGRPGIETTIFSLYEQYSSDWRARDALLNIAGHARLEVLREVVLKFNEYSYSKLIKDQMGLGYILSLKRNDDMNALGIALKVNPDISESRTALLIAELSWKVLDARTIAEIVAKQMSRGKIVFSINWVLTGDVAEDAEDHDLYRLTSSLLIHLIRGKNKSETTDSVNTKFVQLVMDMLARVIQRPTINPMHTTKLCFVLNRYVTKHHYDYCDTTKISAALSENKEVRLAYLRGLIQLSDKTVNSISSTLYSSFYLYVKGDEKKLDVPSFTQFIDDSQKNAVKLRPKKTPHFINDRNIDKNSKLKLLEILDGIRDASKRDALAWVAEWLSHSLNQTRYSECDFSLFQQAAGKKIAQAVRQGLSNLWRSQEPTWDESEHNTTYYITIAGLQGLHLDMGDGSNSQTYSELEVRRAIRYAHFEINGYPKWFWPLVSANNITAEHELGIVFENSNNSQVAFEMAKKLVQNLGEAPLGIQQALAPSVWSFVQDNSNLDQITFEAALKVVVSVIGIIDTSTFEQEARPCIELAFEVEQLNLQNTNSEILETESISVPHVFEEQVNSSKPQRNKAVIWGSYWLWSYPGSFCIWWKTWHVSHTQASEDFMFSLAASLGGNRGASLNKVAEKGSPGLSALKMIYEALRILVKEEDDIKHESGLVYSPGDRDFAQGLRDSLIPAIAHAKSEEAYAVLEELRQKSDGHQSKFLRFKQFMMREEQFAKKPISQKEYMEFERSFAPRVSDSMAFAMAVETDILTVKSKIETGEFSLRRFFNSLNFNRIKTDNDGFALEEDFQALLGSELNYAAGNRYTVTLESILPEGTRRDVLCQIGDMRATIELKMSLRWTLKDYIESLEMQLQGQYMMAPNSKIGFFVIVLQKERNWMGLDEKQIGFEELLTILRNKAREKEIEDSSVYLRVIGIDATPRKDFRAVPKVSRSTSKAKIVKYADDVGNTWSGRGRVPKWILDAQKVGKSREDFLVDLKKITLKD